MLKAWAFLGSLDCLVEGLGSLVWITETAWIILGLLWLAVIASQELLESIAPLGMWDPGLHGQHPHQLEAFDADRLPPKHVADPVAQS